MKNIFKTIPRPEYTNYSQIHQDDSTGQTYADRFTTSQRLIGMWELEKSVLKKVVLDLNPERILDFATGTGRVISFLEQIAPQSELHGIDLSESMLEVARKNTNNTQLLRLDTRNAVEHYGPETFDLLTAFRFFPNADPVLREEAAATLGQLVKPGGHIVINNHRNFWSISYVLMRLVSSSRGVSGSRNTDMIQLFAKHGFNVVRCYSLGIFPQNDRKSILLPWKLIYPVERFNCRFLSTLHTAGINIVFVFQKQS
jgi:SAM-dependent methyltransferase